MRLRSRLRHCATSLKLSGSILNIVCGIFHSPNPISLSMALGSTQPLTELSTRIISLGIKLRKADNPITFGCCLS